ncbi:COG3415 family protein [Photobacterium leiognathi]|uniref:hypothetical protein n=1 Tax=Photobacterium leiognathi TaxID=553611 RepID=UPI00298186FF|nr:hypothetical protein [Photobacterium leiognathi]
MTHLLSNGMLLAKKDKYGKSYLRVQILENGEFLLVDIETSAEFIFEKVVLEKLVADGCFSLADQSEYNSIPTKESKLLDEQERRLKYVQGILKADIPLGSHKKFELYTSIKSIELNDCKPPSAMTLYRWVKKYVNSNGDKASLIPEHRKSGNRNPRLSSEHVQFINSVLDSVVGRPKNTIVYNIYLDKLAKHNEQRVKTGLQRIKPVSLETIRKRLKKRITPQTPR